MNTNACLLGLVLLVAGCAEAPLDRPTPIVRPGLIMIPADQAKYYGFANNGAAAPASELPTSPTSVANVETEPEVTALQFNRYPDPAAPNELMHEAHVVYRREGTPRWKLQPSGADQQLLIGPQFTDGRGELKPVQSQELDTFLRDERTNLQRQQEVMAKLIESQRALGEQQQRLHQELLELRNNGASKRAGSETNDSPTAGPATSSSQNPSLSNEQK